MPRSPLLPSSLRDDLRGFMATQAESRLTDRIRKVLRGGFPGSWWYKTAGNNRVGTPDLLGCVEGRFFAFEVKVEGRENTVTAIQEAMLEEVRKAGGVAEVVSHANAAHAIVKAALDN